jgi:serine/threonine-protein kinase
MLIPHGTVVLGRFRVGELLESTRLAWVYRATDQTSGQDAVLKVLRRARDPRHIARFEREAGVMGRISHPCVVSLLGWGFVDGRPCLAVARLLGETLADRLAARGALPWREAVELMVDVLSGLAALHDAGVLHRNVAPASVVITQGPSERAALANLDLAIPVGSRRVKLTSTGQTHGTTAYLAPEYALDEVLDARADVYGAAMTLYQAMTGQLPHQANSVAELIGSFSRPIDAPVAPETLPPIPARLQETVLAALAFDRFERTASVEELLRGLRGARRTEQLSAGRTTTPAKSRTGGAEVVDCVLGLSVPFERASAGEVGTWLEGQLGAAGAVYVVDASTVVGRVATAGEAFAARLAEAVKLAAVAAFGEDAGFIWTVALPGEITEASLAGDTPLPDLVVELLGFLGTD